MLANIGALAEVFMHLLRALCYIFTLIKLDKHILNKIFDFDLIKKNSEIDKKSEIFNLKSKTINFLLSNNSVYNVKQIPSFIGVNDSQNHKYLYNNFVEVSSQKIIPGVLESRIQPKGTHNILNFLSKQNKKQELNFNFFETIRIFCCNCCIGNLKLKSDLYDKAKIVLDDYLDIYYIIQKLEELEKLKIVSLTYEQIAVFNNIAKDFCTLDDKQNESKFHKFKNLDKDKNKLAEIISIFPILQAFE